MPSHRPFTVLIPARMASTRLPDKPLADIAGKPMVVRVAERAADSGAQRVVVAADDARIVAACTEHGVAALMTRADHASGSDRLAEAATLLGLSGDDVVVNVQGDEPLIEPGLIAQCATRLAEMPGCVMSTAAHALHDAADYTNSNVVKLVMDGTGCALLFSRAPIPWWRDGSAAAGVAALPGDAQAPALRHIGLYAYRAGFLQQFPELSSPPLERTESLEQLRVLWHGFRIAVHVTDLVPGPGVDTAADLERVRTLFAAG
jgi:3-deoxy-manno-octulosonate cytidylyltransferase (CMP-KDO synthetase)